MELLKKLAEGDERAFDLVYLFVLKTLRSALSQSKISSDALINEPKIPPSPQKSRWLLADMRVYQTY